VPGSGAARWLVAELHDRGTASRSGQQGKDIDRWTFGTLGVPRAARPARVSNRRGARLQPVNFSANVQSWRETLGITFASLGEKIESPQVLSVNFSES
jgi:hypothetical protein